MLEVVYGQTARQVVAGQLRDVLSEMQLDGTLNIGYPVLASADETVTVDALLVCREHGLEAARIGGYRKCRWLMRSRFNRSENRQM